MSAKKIAKMGQKAFQIKGKERFNTNDSVRGLPKM